ncbi:MAG: hypothetical protein ACI4A3_01920 [Lachnospiraceae bacterium]
MKQFFKKICLLGGLVLMMGFATACGSDGAEGELESIEQQALDQKLKADDSVNKVNEDTNKLNEETNSIDQE